MSGLNSLLSNTSSTSTTMPAWYDKAQQDVVAGAANAAATAPKLADTVAGTAINTLSNPNTNPFTQSQNTLNTIAQGAANPWLADPTTGGVKPNTNTPLGGLFDAQNKQLQTLIPGYEAPSNAASITGGNFGSLRNQTAANTALTNAQADLFSKQMQAALQNQATGVSAATGLGDVGAKGVATETTLGKATQADPFTNIGNYAKILSTVNAPVTTTNKTDLAPINQLGALSSAFGTSPSAIANNVGGILDKIFGGSSGSSSGTLPDFSGIYPSDLPTPNNTYNYGNYTGANDTPLAYDPNSNIPVDYNNTSSNTSDYSNWYTPNDTVDPGFGYTPSIGP
jgi:hypothetical protein